MNCAELDPLLHGYLDGEFDLGRSLEIECHLEACRACAARFRALKDLRRALQAPELYQRAPTHLRQRIRAAMPGKRRRRWVPALAAAMVLLGVSLGVVLGLRLNRGEDFLTREAVAGHVRSLLPDRPIVDVVSADTHTVKPWFHGHVDFAPPVRDLADQGYPLRGGRVEFLDNQKVAVLVYQRRKHVINLFVWPQAGSEVAPQEQTYQGYVVLHWVRDGFTYWAVSDMSSEGLQRFADLLQR